MKENGNVYHVSMEREVKVSLKRDVKVELALQFDAEGREGR